MKKPERKIDDSTNERKWRAFAGFYVRDFNARKAYADAGYKDKNGYGAYRLLNKPEVQKMITEEMEERKRRLNISQDEVVNEMARIAFSDARDYMRWNERELIIKDSKDLTEDQARAVESVVYRETAAGVTISVKLYNKLSALDNLFKHFGLYTERKEMIHSYGTVNIPSMVDPDDWESLVKQQMSIRNGSSNSTDTTESTLDTE